jgi:hypothetical protein
MDNKAKVAAAIQRAVSTMMDRVMHKVLVEDPFIKEKHHSLKPLYAALVPDEVFKGSHFERRFVTPFGGVWEKLAQVVAKEAHGECLMRHSISSNIGDESLRRIQEVLNRLEHASKGKNRVLPNWQEELDYIKAGKGNPIPVSVVCDVYVHNPTTGKRYAFELKGPLPNSDQTKVSKEKMFKLLAMDGSPVDGAYYALPYNPYGLYKEDYQWSFPKRWFDMCNDPCVLIGNEFWDFIGGEGAYANFIHEVNQLGKEYRERIYREFLGIEPPINNGEYLLK